MTSRPTGAMPLSSHLRELRKRLAVSALALLLGGIGGWFLTDAVWNALSAPVMHVGEAGAREAAVNFSTVTAAFDVRLQTALCIGVALASPVWIYQVFAFALPGMTRRERAHALGFVGAGVPLFAGGCVAGWVLIPHIVEVLASFAPSGSSSLFDASTYFKFAAKLIVASGIAFVLPLILVALNFMGLMSGRTILRGWRIAIMAIATFAALATPAADVLSMFLLAVPMIALYLASVGVAMTRDRVVQRRAAISLEGGSVSV